MMKIKIEKKKNEMEKRTKEKRRGHVKKKRANKEKEKPGSKLPENICNHPKAETKIISPTNYPQLRKSCTLTIAPQQGRHVRVYK